MSAQAAASLDAGRGAIKATRSPRRWRALRHPLLVAGLLGLVPVLLASAIGPLLAPDPFSQNLRATLEPPGLAYPAGTDQLGRDLLSRILHGGRYSLVVSTASLLLAGVAGSLLGLVTGFFQNRATQAIDATLDFLMAFPSMMLGILAAALLGNNLVSIVGAIGLAMLPRFALIVRSRVLSIAQTGYVEATRAVGATSPRLLLRHVLPNSLAPIIVLTTLYYPFVISLEASLSYLGLGVPPDVPTWGRVIADGQPLFQIAPWVSVMPGLMIVLTSLSFNLLGDGLRDVLDPKLRER